MRAAVFAMSDANHFRCVSTVVAALAAAGVKVRVYSDRRFAPEVEAAGATLDEVLTRFPLDAVDASSQPRPCRHVTWSGVHGEAIAAEVSAFAPDLVVGDAFAVIGRVVSAALGVPYVCVVIGHHMDPARVIPTFDHDPRVALAPACLAAVARLRERHGWEDATPFAWYHLSSDLNLYCEPPAFLAEEERAAFAPLAFWGSLPAARAATPPRAPARPPRRIYASMGTIVWRYHAAEAYAALQAVADAVRRRERLEAVLSLGGAELGAAAVAALESPRVSVTRWLDQFEQLRHADAFVTHCGINSVPMIGYPCFGDQPGMAVRCRELGIAVTLAEAPLTPVCADDVGAALDRLTAEGPAIDAALALARGHELAAIAERPAVVERITALA